MYTFEICLTAKSMDHIQSGDVCGHLLSHCYSRYSFR